MEHLRELEEALHTDEVSSDKTKLAKLLHPTFIEIGYSGATHTYQSIIDAPEPESPSKRHIWSQDYEYFDLGPNMAQLLYKEARIGKDGQLVRHAKRTSIWIKSDGQWQIKYHQATPTEAFKQSDR